MNAIVSWGTYLPAWRLDRGEIRAAVGGPGGTGARAVACYDEDTTSMAVEAGRTALAATDLRPGALLFATTDPAYLDRTNATAIHAALALDPAAPAYDMVGSVRSGIGALRSALHTPGPTLVVTADRRGGLPGSADEAGGGDGASAVLLRGTNGTDSAADPGSGAAAYLGGASTSAELLDRWRLPHEPASRVWEERFGAAAYRPLAEQAVAGALADAGLTANAVDTWLVTGTHQRAVAQLAASLTRAGGTVADEPADLGNTGAAHPLLLLAGALERSPAGQVIALVVVADGVEVLLFHTAAGVTGARPDRTVAAQAAAGGLRVPYPTFLTWRGLLDREPPRRPEPDRPAAPAAYRGRDWKFALIGSHCLGCGTRHLPPHRVCLRCGAVDRMHPEPLAGVPGRIATFTVDRLTYSLSPPVVIAVIDYDGGGRYTCELTDVDASTVAIGDRVEMTFRRHYRAGGIHNYAWKARPTRAPQTGGS